MLKSKDSFSNLIKAEIEEFYNVSIPDCTDQKHFVYILSRYLLGVYEKRLYVNLLSGQVVNYRISHFIFNKKII